MANSKWMILSPDGFTIEFDRPTYPSLKKALVAFENWCKRFEIQGYYSSNNGRIPLNELFDYCTIKKI